jgi:hypothetical protein
MFTLTEHLCILDVNFITVRPKYFRIQTSNAFYTYVSSEQLLKRKQHAYTYRCICINIYTMVRLCTDPYVSPCPSKAEIMGKYKVNGKA